MKEITVDATIPDCTAKSYFEVLYSTDEALRAFHAQVNNDPNATAGPWSPDGVRTAEFVMPMNVPAMLKKVIGMDAVPVVEAQRLRWEGDGVFRIDSEPLLNFPGANKFTTSGALTVASQPDGSCLVTAVMRCAASMPWPMASTVEGMMATEAAASIATFLRFCKDYYARWREAQREVPAAPAPAPAAAGRQPSTTADGDTFYDAVEDEADLSRRPSSVTQPPTSDEVVPYTPPRLEDVIVDALRAIQASTAATAASVAALEALTRNMDDNMQLLRDKLVGRRPPPPRPAAAPTTPARPSTPAPPPPPKAAAAAASGGGGDSTTWGGYSAGFASGLLTASLVCGVAVVAYGRYARQAGS